MKNLMTTTALVLATALPVVAESTKAETPFVQYSESRELSADILASNLIGMRIYTSERDLDSTDMVEIDGDWNDIGEVSDVVMSRDGKTRSVLLDIGGFLGIGEKTVAVDMDQLKFVNRQDDAGDYFIVFTADRQMLEQAEPFNFKEMGAWASAAWGGTKDAVSSSVETAEAKASDAYSSTKQAASNMTESVGDAASEAAAATEETVEAAGREIDETADQIASATVDAEGFRALSPQDVTVEALTGVAVYDANQEWIGEVSDVIKNQSGEITEAVLDVGGFIGIGERSVATDVEMLTIKQKSDGEELRVYVNATKDELEKMPEYNES